MSFALVVNNTTKDITGGLLTISGQDTTLSSIPANGGSMAHTISIPDVGSVPVKLKVEGPTHSGTSISTPLDIGSFSSLVMEVTENGYVNYYNNLSATDAEPINP